MSAARRPQLHLALPSAETRSGNRDRAAMLVRARRRARPYRWTAVATGVVVAVGGFVASLFVHHRVGSEPLTYRIEGAEVHPGGYVEVGPFGRVVLRFSDGSNVALTDGARVHVRAVDEHGAHVSLEEG